MQKKTIFFINFSQINRFWIYILLLSFLSYYAHAQERLYIMPYEQEQALRDLIVSIAKAQKTINIAIYSFTNREIAKALRDASSRGIKINIIYDMGQKNIENICRFQKTPYLCNRKIKAT